MPPSKRLQTVLMRMRQVSLATFYDFVFPYNYNYHYQALTVASFLLRGLNENNKDDDAGKNIFLSILCNKIFHRQFLCQSCDKKMRETAWLAFIKSEVVNYTDPDQSDKTFKRENSECDPQIHKRVKHVKDQECGRMDDDISVCHFVQGTQGKGGLQMDEERDGGEGGGIEIGNGESGGESEESDQDEDVGGHQSEEEMMDGDE